MHHLLPSPGFGFSGAEAGDPFCSGWGSGQRPAPRGSPGIATPPGFQLQLSGRFCVSGPRDVIGGIGWVRSPGLGSPLLGNLGPAPRRRLSSPGWGEAGSCLRKSSLGKRWVSFKKAAHMFSRTGFIVVVTVLHLFQSSSAKASHALASPAARGCQHYARSSILVFFPSENGSKLWSSASSMPGAKYSFSTQMLNLCAFSVLRSIFHLMHFIGVLTIQRGASELNQSAYGERQTRTVSYQVYFFFFLFFFRVFFFFIITSFAQQQPRVDNEMHAVDRREPDKALFMMESPSAPAPHPLPTRHEQRWPRLRLEERILPERAAGVLSLGVMAQPRGHAVTFQTSACSPGPVYSSRGGRLRPTTRYVGTFHFQSTLETRMRWLSRGPWGVGSAGAPCHGAEGVGETEAWGMPGLGCPAAPHAQVPPSQQLVGAAASPHPRDHGAPKRRRWAVPLFCFT